MSISFREELSSFVTSFFRKIIGRRKRHEYKLRRRVKSKEDYMNYIMYETNLLSLVALRRKVCISYAYDILL